jgi:hypothetical protein
MVTATHFGCAVSCGCAVSPQASRMSSSSTAVSYNVSGIFKNYCFISPVKVGFYRGDVLTLLEDIEELQPTLFTSVPRLYNRIYDKVCEERICSDAGISLLPGGAATKANREACNVYWHMLQVMGAITQSSPVTRRLFHLAYESKRTALKRGDLSGGRFGPLWDRLVFSKVRARLGGGSAQAIMLTTMHYVLAFTYDYVPGTCTDDAPPNDIS